jgi:hypothetical protein
MNELVSFLLYKFTERQLVFLSRFMRKLYGFLKI